MFAAPPDPAEQEVKPLRDDVQLHKGAELSDGSPTFLVQDPLANTYIHIGWREFEILSRWDHGISGAICEAVNAQTTLTIEVMDVLALEGFLKHNFL